MENLSMSFAVIRDDIEFWISYEMELISHDRATETHPPESVYAFIEGSATGQCLDDEDIRCPIDYDELQELAEAHAKKHEVQVG